MKRTIIFFMMISCAAVLLFAQGNERRGQNRGCAEPVRRNRDYSMHMSPRGQQQLRSTPAPKSESTTVNGNLTIAQGMIAVESEGVTYLTGGLNRFVGFIDGLQEGALVNLEGDAFPVSRNNTEK